MKRVGIFVKKPESLFSNGCYQQSLFLYNMINNLDGFHCEFITLEPDYKKYDTILDIEVAYFDDVYVKKNKFDYILMLSLTVNDVSILKLIKDNNIKLVDILCGNLFVLLQEEFVFECHDIMRNYNNEAIDEVWVLEMYTYSKEYLELLYNKPVIILPYVWDTDIIRQYISTNNIVINKTDNEKINICIYEPNMSIHKNAFIPLLIAERFYREFPDRLNKIYLFCKEKVLTNGYLQNMSIFKDNKIENYGRIVMPFSLKIIQDNNPYKSVVLSYTHLNDLNFLHLELLYIGVPIVHNCEPFQNDLYYDKDNVKEAVCLLEKARTNDADPKKNADIICKYSGKNIDIQKKWLKEFKRLN
jgi:hypothetical protein